MVMEALEGYSQMIRYEIMVCHAIIVNRIFKCFMNNISNHYENAILLLSVIFQGHSGEESDLPLVKIGNEPKNEKERLHILRNMHAHAQFCMSGDHTLSATVQVNMAYRIFYWKLH